MDRNSVIYFDIDINYSALTRMVIITTTLSQLQFVGFGYLKSSFGMKPVGWFYEMSATCR